MVPLGTGKEKPRNFVFKGKTKNKQGHKLQHSSQAVQPISDRALLKLTPTIFSYTEYCSFSNLRNIFDFSKTSLEVTISIHPMLTDTQADMLIRYKQQERLCQHLLLATCVC